MKKFISVATILLILIVGSISVSASDINTHEQSIINKLSGSVQIGGSILTFDPAHVKQAENFFKLVDTTEEDAAVINAEIDKALQIYMNDSLAGETDLNKLPQATRSALIACANNALARYSAYMTYDVSTGTVTITGKDGKVLFHSYAQIIKQTGADYTMAVIITSSLLVALVVTGILISRKKRAAKGAAVISKPAVGL